MDATRSKSFASSSNEGIFERSLSFSMSSLPPTSRQKLARTLSNCSQQSSGGYTIPVHHNTEDFVAPVLDTTTEILTNPALDLNDVNIVCCCEEEDDEQATDRDSNDEASSQPNNHSKSSLTAHGQHPHNHTHPKKPRSRSRSRSSISKSLMSSMSPTGTSSQSQLASKSHHSSVGNIGPVSPSVHSSKSNVSLHQFHQQHQDMSNSPDRKTIKFYSFADMLDNEKQEEQPFSDEDASMGSPPEFRGFSFSEPAPVDDDIHHKRTNSSHSPPVSVDGFQTISMRDYISKLN
ncbi:hypothetical protein CLIB1423_03S02410 [[Candida] railenensis]|uniref:Uncharacterized protein n=1 Tax=[Candida] railenensis TaxID=45579 RepID=A0A9P0QM73_9ASCO|nr:hypothetical protein CLIB1423_03S02410 [[Candida] railenensis]